MHPLTVEWYRKAEADWLTARREMAVKDDPNNDAVCFHAQQCAEKYLKALLRESGLAIPRIHDLSSLMEPLLKAYPEFSSLVDRLDSLSDQAVDVRYPGVFSDQEDAREALEAAGQVRSRIREVLRIS